jgi:DNA mismatch repair protein MutS
MELQTMEGASGNVGRRTCSLLFDDTAARADVLREQPPECFSDLNLDQVVSAVTAGREDRHLEPYYFTPVASADAVEFRHGVFRDLEDRGLLAAVRAFADQMEVVRRDLAFAEKFSYAPERQRWFLDAAREYRVATVALGQALSEAPIAGRGFLRFREYVIAYISGHAFTSLGADAERVLNLLEEVTYCVHLRGGRVEVSRYEGEPDYTAQVIETFARFRQGAVTEYRVRLADRVDMNHVEGTIAELVVKLFPDEFADLARFCDAYAGFLDPVLDQFERETQFYLAYLEFTDRMRSAGLPFCYPRVSEHSKAERVVDAFDVALANLLVGQSRPVVTNGFELGGPERVLVVSGPNQGGKTTFARMVGQVHYLASIGCPVPGRSAELLLVDQVLTHFETRESLTTQSGKLRDDLLRIRSILERSTERTLVLLNEIFTSTTADDALLLGTEVLRRVIAADVLCVCVTFVDELSRLGPSTVSMVGTVRSDDPTIRTFRIVRMPSDGRADAVVLAEKYGLSYDQLRKKLAS